MKQIEPLKIWVNGKTINAVWLYLQINFDNLTNSATFYYSLKDDQENKIVDGNIDMSGKDYTDWDGTNDYAYNFAGVELGLTFVSL